MSSRKYYVKQNKEQMSPANALKDLREAMGDVSQINFAVLHLQKSVTMVQRYEKGENIALKDLALMVQFSRQAKRHDLAKVFKEALIEALGPEVVRAIREDEANGITAEKTAGKSSIDKGRLSA